MKKKALLFGTIPALAIASVLLLSNTGSSEGKYSPRLSSHLQVQVDGIKGAFEYAAMLKGEYTLEDWQRANAIAQSTNQDRSTFNWIDLGPDNIGGRTRAIVADRNEINHIYAGSVSGGLFKSINRASTWHRVDEFESNLAISSMCQTNDGALYVATGHQAEKIFGLFGSGAEGYGIYKQEGDGSFSLLDGSTGFGYINEVVCDDLNNVVWVASSGGLKKSIAGAALVDVDAFPSGACQSVAISKDGSLIIARASNKILVSLDNGVSFTDVSANSEEAGKVNMSAVGRAEFAISHEKVSGAYRVYVSASGNALRGIWRSENNGLTWERIAPAFDGTPGGFAPFSNIGVNGQGLYDNVISVVPGAPDRIYLGGITCYTWSTTANWEQISLNFASPTSPFYVHSDNHEFTWDQWGRLYIGNDGGVTFSDNANTLDPEFHHANRGYNVTQFYAIGASAHGDVIGGAQDNGTNANYHNGTTFQEHKHVGGGDGFSADISFINRNLLFTSVYNGGIYRSSDKGSASAPFGPAIFIDGDGSPCNAGAADATGCGEFFTTFEMWENPNDLESADTLRYIAGDSTRLAGSTILVPSATSQMFIEYVTPTDLIFDDTLDFDPALTDNDTIVVDVISGSDFNLGILDWDFIFGAATISPGDSILIHGVEIDDTIIVESYTLIDHFFGTNPARPGLVVDMGNEEQIFEVSWDTSYVQDPYQSWFVADFGNSNGLWMSRNALRFSATSQAWVKVATELGNISSVEFSKDGDYLFIGNSFGSLWRLSGFNQAYSPTEVIEGSTVGGITYDTIIDYAGVKHVMEFQKIGNFPGSMITGIASGPIGDNDLLVVTLGGFVASGRVKRSTNASGASPTFTNLGFPGGSGTGAAAPGIPCFSVIIDRNDADIIVVGTEFGIFATESGGESPGEWSNISGALGDAPVYDLDQNWRTWDEGCKRPGEIYAGSFGRGIWSTEALLSLPSSDNLDKNKFVPNIKLYPNPVDEAGTVAFDLATNEDVTLQIFNLSGQIVHQVVAKDLIAGTNQIVFNANDLPKGTYILRLSSESMNETTKFIKH